MSDKEAEKKNPFYNALSKLHSVFDVYEFKLETTDPIKIICGKFDGKHEFRQIWFDEKVQERYRCAYTRYDGTADKWFTDENVLEQLLELKADSRLGFPPGTPMLRVAEPDDAKYQKLLLELQKEWKFVRLAYGPCIPAVKKAFEIDIYCLLLGNDAKDLHKVYITCAIDKDLSKLCLEYSAALLNTK